MKRAVRLGTGREKAWKVDETGAAREEKAKAKAGLDPHQSKGV